VPAHRVLVLDDERLVRWSLSQRLRADGIDVTEASTAAEAVQAAPPDAAILDYRLPDGDGISVLKKLRAVDPDLPVIMLTAHNDTDLIVEAIKAGASDYITKPFEVDDVALRLSRAIEANKGTRELRRLKEDLARPFSFGSLIGESEPMRRVKALASKVAQSPTSTVLLTGESGTGKDLLAKVIHFGSARAARPFMLVENVVVTAALRRSGIGTALLDAVVALARDAGCYKIQLLSRASRHGAHAFYEARGFRTVAQGYRLYLD